MIIDVFVRFVVILTEVLSWAILVRAILSWFPNISRGNPLVDLLFQVTEPVLAPIRRVMPTLGGIDFSPLVAFFVLRFIGDAAVALVRA